MATSLNHEGQAIDQMCSGIEKNFKFNLCFIYETAENLSGELLEKLRFIKNDKISFSPKYEHSCFRVCYLELYQLIIDKFNPKPLFIFQQMHKSR